MNFSSKSFQSSNILIKKYIFFSYPSITAVFRKSDPSNNLILRLESDPKSKRAQFKFILTKAMQKIL